MNDITKKVSNGYKLGALGAAIATLFFFLPWVGASGFGMSISFNGWDIATGLGMGGGKTGLFLVLLAGLGVIGLAVLAYLRGSLTVLDSFGLIGLGVFALIVLWISLSDIGNIGLGYRIGLWGVILGFFAVIAGGYLNFKNPAPQPPQFP